MGNPVKVMHVFGSLNIGGAESRIMDVYRKIDKTKVHFDFISLDTTDNQFFESEIKSLGGKTLKIASPRKIGIIEHYRQLKKLFFENNQNNKLIVHAHTLHHCGFVLLAAKKAGVNKRIAHARNTKSQHNSFFSRLMIFIGKLLIKFYATDRLAITEDAAMFLYGKSSIKSNKVKIIPNAIDLSKYDNISQDKLSQLKAQYELKDETIKIGHVGRFEIMKNHSFLIKLFFDFNRIHPNSVLILIGDGTLKNKMEDLATELGINNNILFLGIRDDVALWMNIFNIVIMPSLFEGLCGVALESQAAGTPCILSDRIPKAVDLNLKLIKYISLNENFDVWINEIEKLRTITKPSWGIIKKKFDERNYSLEKEISLLHQIYDISE